MPWICIMMRSMSRDSCKYLNKYLGAINITPIVLIKLLDNNYELILVCVTNITFFDDNDWFLLF